MREPASWAGAYRTMPFIAFPRNWLVQMLPPSGGASIRFRVRLKDREYDGADAVSIYADFDEKLGSHRSGPYWEVYPNVDRDVSRFAIDDIDNLLAEIQRSLEAFDAL